MKFVLTILALGLALTPAARAEKLALTGGTAINPGDGKIIEHAVVLIDGNSIIAVGDANTQVPADAKRVDCTGQFILPGYIDTHVHFFQSGDLYTRPDVVDLTSVRSYADEHAWIEQHLDDTFARYLRCGITSVVDVGGPLWNFSVRARANSTAKAPRVAVAGPLISSVARPQLELNGEAPIVKIDTPAQGVALVQKLAKEKPDYIKIWYIVNAENPVEKFRPVVHAVVAESHRLKLRVAVHATELEAARAAVEEGADLLVHSVIDKPVDQPFVRLLQERGTILTPTLVVFERYGRTFANKLDLTAEEKAWGDPEVIASLEVTKIPADKLPDRIKKAMDDPEKVLAGIQKTYEVALKNLKTLEDAGITIAAGTDAGNIGTIHGPALFREFQLMKEAGLTNMQILQSTTANGAKVFGGATGAKIGALAPGKFADLVVLNSNPLDDITHASDIAMVIKDGVSYPAQSTLPAADTDMNPIAEGYVHLVLALGQHDADYVDAFYGPAEWKSAAEKEKKPLDAIGGEAAQLRDRLAKMATPTDEMLRLRREYLLKQLGALEARVRILQGARMKFDEESRALYDAVAPTYPDAHFVKILAELESKIPGQGPLAARYEEWRKAFVIPKEKLDAVFQLAIKECRARTLAHAQLPPNESFTVEYVTDKPWGGYNWYKGDYRSVIQVNTDLPI
ncbi:MAG: amidohydrolase family protein, partial [Verrucomicrobiota bacterium]|nr:amidohydrolase family protein [Verrucomicrobiota bacterium]